jgi:tRNA (guanine-N7-)-methyltransferase
VPYDAAQRPARPHTAHTADGRRLSEVLSYTRRGNRLSDRQAVAWTRHHAQWFIPEEAADADDFDIARWFGREAPLIVEIGSGVGEATAKLAAERPSYNIVALEVWAPGVAQTFERLDDLGADNVRLMCVDAVWSVEHLLRPQSVSELWTFFPDPWPKTRHQRRRLVRPAFAAAAASALVTGGAWRLATDWPAYAAQMLDVLGAEPLLRNRYDGAAPRWGDRPLTRFERRGLAAGRPVTDLCFERM